MDSTEEGCKRITKIICWWQNILNLHQWNIAWGFKSELTSKKHLMEILVTRSRAHAKILIKESTLKSLDKKEFEICLVHELTHLLYDKVAEEHEFQVSYIMNKGRQEEAKVRFRRQLEISVEHTAQMLCKVLPLCDVEENIKKR